MERLGYGSAMSERHNKKAKHHHGKVKASTTVITNSSSGSSIRNQQAAAVISSNVELSKSVMGMKFMQRIPTTDSCEPIESQALAINQKSRDAWFRTDHFISESVDKKLLSLSHCISLIVSDSSGVKREVPVIFARGEIDIYARLPGRRSFNGCNRAMEKNYQQIIDAKYIETQERKENRVLDHDIENGKLITDEAMADIYQDLIALPRGPNQGKRANNNSSKPSNENKKKHKSKR